MSALPLALITGGNGFVGYAVIAGALKAGVRSAVENTVKAFYVYIRLGSR